jgi:hypothetical protein
MVSYALTFLAGLAFARFLRTLTRWWRRPMAIDPPFGEHPAWGGPYRTSAPAEEYDCDCPCTGKCVPWFPAEVEQVDFGPYGPPAGDWADDLAQVLVHTVSCDPKQISPTCTRGSSFAVAEARRELDKAVGTFVSLNKTDVHFLITCPCGGVCGECDCSCSKQCPACDDGSCDRCTKARLERENPGLTFRQS